MTTTAPFVLGLAGSAGSGKTAVANALAPSGQVVDESNKFWTKLSFALPIHRIVAARQKIQGVDAFSRQCYEIHNTLNDVFRGALTYDELVDLTYEVVALTCQPEGKPRSFMQYVGTELCRDINPDVWVQWMDRKISEEFRFFTIEQERSEETDPDYIWKDFCVAIDDVRFANECYYVSTLHNSCLLRFEVSSTLAAKRIATRDGAPITFEQTNHASELGLKEVPDDVFDAIIDTNDLSLKEQVTIVQDIIKKKRVGSIYGALK
jgi:hypothetical protein